MTRFDYNSAVVGVILRSPELKATLEAVTEAVAAEARRLAPVGRYSGGGRYRDSIAAEVDLDEDGLLGRVNAHHFTAWWVEAGTSRMPARAPLRRAMESGVVREALR